MSFNIRDKQLTGTIQRHLNDASNKNADALEKLSSGTVFTHRDPRPADRALAEGLEFKLRSMSSSKRNINEAVSLLQTAESSLSEISNMVVRMKEINIAGANTTMSDRERRYLFIEYEALNDEINRIAVTTDYNGIPLLNGESDDVPEELVFRVGDPFTDEDSIADDDDINAIRFDGLKNVVATSLGLGINSARDLLSDSNEVDGIALEDIEDLMVPEDDDLYATTFDQALGTISTQRAVFGALQTRMQHAMDYIDVYSENITAAKSHIADTDYASEVSNMAASRILMQAATAALSQGNINSQLTLNLLSSLM